MGDDPMNARTISIAILLAALAAAPAGANFGGGSKDEEKKPVSKGISSISMTPREEAERLYMDGKEEVEKAKKDLAEDKAKNAGKKFKKALDRGERAIGLDPKYAEAWNLVGYSSRHLKKYERALEAYGKALELKPDYAEAREYLGEAYVELGQIDKAKEQLAWLQRNVPASEEAKDLAKEVEEYEKAHPPAAGSARPDTTQAAPRDTTGGGSGR
jgi:tetratricopeptide (TPR) repeat protein